MNRGNPIGHVNSVDEGFYLFAQAFTSIFQDYIILDNNRTFFKVRDTHKLQKDVLGILVLKILSEKCREIGYTLLCGNSEVHLIQLISKQISIQDLRQIWSGVNIRSL